MSPALDWQPWRRCCMPSCLALSAGAHCSTQVQDEVVPWCAAYIAAMHQCRLASALRSSQTLRPGVGFCSGRGFAPKSARSCAAPCWAATCRRWRSRGARACGASQAQRWPPCSSSRMRSRSTSPRTSSPALEAPAGRRTSSTPTVARTVASGRAYQSTASACTRAPLLCARAIAFCCILPALRDVSC